MVDLLRKSVCQNYKLRHNDGRQVQNGAASGWFSVGMIFHHLEGMTLESDEVDINGMLFMAAISVDGNSSPWVTHTMGTWGGATIIDEVVASVVAE